MKVITFDIETANWMSDTGSNDPADLTIALVAVHDSETGQYSSYLVDELSALWSILERTDILVGYNSNHFDIPLLNKYYPGDLSRIKSLDIMAEVHATLGRRLKLDALAEGTLGTKKIANGSLSVQWWRAGEVEKVREYCLKDVEITRRILDYALEHNALKYKELGATKEVKLDASKWLAGTGSAMTYTMGF